MSFSKFKHADVFKDNTALIAQVKTNQPISSQPISTFDNALRITEVLAWPIAATVIFIGMALILKPFFMRVKMRISGQDRIDFLRLQLNDIRDDIREKIEERDPFASKKKSFLNIPSISFYYADKSQIEDFYNSYFREPSIERLVSKIVSEVSGDIKGTLPKVLESKIGAKGIQEWVSTLKLPETTLHEMFLRYQRETIKKGQVTVGLELVDIELSDLQEFQEMVSELDKRFELKIDRQLLDETEKLLKEKAAERTLNKLENAAGSVVIEGKFSITEIDSNYYKCTYQHPVSEYTPESITISFLLSKASIEPHVSGNFLASVNKSIPLKVYGNIWLPLDRRAKIWDLQVRGCLRSWDLRQAPDH